MYKLASDLFGSGWGKLLALNTYLLHLLKTHL